MKKADVAEHPGASIHIGLLVDGPPGAAGCPSISHPNNFRFDVDRIPSVTSLATEEQAIVRAVEVAVSARAGHESGQHDEQPDHERAFGSLHL